MLSLSLALHKCAKNTSINLWNAYYFDFFSYAYSFLRSFLRNILDASYFRTGYGENLISRRHKLLKLLHKSYLISYNELMDISMTINYKTINKEKQYATKNAIILKKIYLDFPVFHHLCIFSWVVVTINRKLVAVQQSEFTNNVSFFQNLPTQHFFLWNICIELSYPCCILLRLHKKSYHCTEKRKIVLEILPYSPLNVKH